MCDVFPALTHLIDRDCETMSGGEMQMVSIWRALLGSPGVVLFDEPSQGLAPKIVQDLMKTVLRMKEEGIVALIVEQNALAALEVSDRVYVMDQGLIVHEGTGAGATGRSGDAPPPRGDVKDGDAGIRKLSKVYPEAASDRDPDLPADRRLHHRGPRDRRHDGAERVGQDDALRTCYWIERADVGRESG